MDLLSENSYSNKTSSDIGNINDYERNEYNEFSVYYNHILRDSRTTSTRREPSNNRRYQTRLDENNNRSFKYTATPLSNKNNYVLKINDSHIIRPQETVSKKLLFKNVASSVHNLEMVDSNQMTCSKNISNTEVKTNDHNERFQHTTENIVKPKYAEKTTYCRPALNMYNQEFIYKTIERNARLQGLLRRLVLAREKEKQEVAWNNYINELKNKYRYYSNDFKNTSDNSTDYPSIIDDYYNTRFACKQSNLCQNLLQDFYSASSEIQSDNYASHGQRPLRSTLHSYDSNRHCFINSSQGRLMMLNRERPKYHPQNRTTSRYFHGNKIFVNRDNAVDLTKKNQSNKLMRLNKQQVANNLSVQTDLNTCRDNNGIVEETFQDKYARVASNVDRLKQKIMQSEKDLKYCSLASIENKLDVLINSINNFIADTRSKRVDTRSKEVTCHFSDISHRINKTKSDTFGLVRREKIVCSIVQEKPRSTLTFNEGNGRNTVDDILYEEMHKSDRAKRDIHDILNGSKGSVHITFDIPTKERSTEMTDSLYKTDKVVVEQIDCENNQRITIAVNTDPLGLLALFRVSTETVKRILSYMPQIDYFSCLSRLPLPQVSRNGVVSHFVCNICGAAFDRPSQLSDHIQEHNLGNSRDCCVCRHVLDMQRHRSGLFSCQHCGQRFTRAYCCELHEHDCGRRLGRKHDVSPSLMLLK